MKKEAANKPAILPKPYDLAKASKVIELASDPYIAKKVLDAEFDEGDEPSPQIFKQKVDGIKKAIEELEDGRKMHLYILHKSPGGMDKSKFQKAILKKFKIWK